MMQYKKILEKINLIFRKYSVFLFVISFGALIFLRWNINLKKTLQMTACVQDCTTWGVVFYDVGILGGLLLSIALIRLLPNILRWILFVFLMGIVFFYVVDIFIYDLLNFRLQLVDVLKYAGNISANKTVAWPRLISKFGIALLFFSGCTLLFIFYSIFSSIKSRKYINIFISLAIFVILLSARYIPDDKDYILQNQNHDVVTSNFMDSMDLAYSEGFLNQISQLPKLNSYCEKYDIYNKSVILLIVESLSVYQSNKFSGIKNYLPQLDAIAGKYAYLDEFYANGFTTDGGLIALLTGYVPFPQVNRYQSTDVFLGYEKEKFNFFSELKKNNIHSNYFTSADLNFLGMDNWLKNLGFEYIEGPEHPIYANLPRGTFNDPGDEKLYQRYLDWLDNERSAERFFSVVQTVTTHPPFIIPGDKNHGEAAAFQYADKALGMFVSALEDRNFFDAGVLIITGDHRSMTLISAEEKKRLGDAAPARVPAVLVGKKFEGVGAIAGQWQQVDVLPSVAAELGVETCTTNFQGEFLKSRKNADYIIHAMGVERNKILVKIKNHDNLFFVKLAGDNTNWVNIPQNTEDAKEVLQEIHRQRARLPVAERNFAHELLKIYRILP